METRKFTPSQKERFLKLASNEIGLIKPSNEELWEEIKKIKRKLGNEDDGDNKKVIDPEEKLVNPEIQNDNGKFDIGNIFDDASDLFEPVDFPAENVTENGGSELEKQNKIGLDKEKKETIIERKTTNNIKLHRPKETKLFLTLFNHSNHLKFLTHRFKDGKRDYDEFINLCRKEFEEALKKYPNVSTSLTRRIEEFTFSEEAKWFTRKGKDKIYPNKGWSEKNFIDWYQKSVNSHPINDSKWNNEMIMPFKETIEVRAGNLSTIIEDAIDQSFGESRNNYIINFNSSESIKIAEFYTDVDKLQGTLYLIFSTIKEISERNLCFNIDVKFENETINGGKLKKLIITHIDSEPTKNSNDPAFAKGDLKSIQSNLWGLCNYEIVGKFPDGIKKRIFLTDDMDEYNNYVKSNTSLDLRNEKVNGFSHVLKFY